MFNPGGTSRITCSAHDPNGDTLSFSWSAVYGLSQEAIPPSNGLRPTISGNYSSSAASMTGTAALRSTASNSRCGIFHSIKLELSPCIFLSTGTQTMQAATATTGRFRSDLGVDHAGHVNSAYAFNGTTSYIEIANTQGLNFQTGITVSFWMYIGALYTREQYPISHGNWQNGWKVSISNDRLRWTVKTATGVKDLDSQTLMNMYQWYFVVAT